MGYLKISPNTFLEKQELDRFKRFLDDDGFRAQLLDNSSSFGFVRKQGSVFTNGLVQEDNSYTVKINEAFLIDSNGNVIHNRAVSQLAVPNDNTFYWIKITHAYSSQEKGTFSIDALGNLTCTSLDAELLTILRGQPNYPSRVRFLNASNNILSYDVEEVIDNNNATLTGSFTAETGLTLSVVGTFTPGYVPLSNEKDLFQYDSATVSLVQSNATTDASITHTTGLDFFMARVKRNGSSILIEDKRNDVWTTNSMYLLQYLSRAVNPLIGVEQVTFNDQFTPRDRNVLELTWVFRCVTFNVDLKLNKVTVSAGSGGLFKATNFDTQFIDGDFDNWRLYVENGTYYNIITSRLNAGTIELTCDNLDATSFYSDVNSLTPISQVLHVTPQAEEIEITCTPDADSSDSTSAAQHGLAETKQVFPINKAYGRMELIVYHATQADYTITYRYKHLLSYGPTIQLPDDLTGYYNENQFNVHGRRVGSTRTSYSNGLITLVLSPKSYASFQQKVDVGDVHGVDTLSITNANVPVINLVVGSSKQYQHYTGSSFVLSADLSINLTSTDVDGAPLKDGASFLLHFEQSFNLNSRSFKIVYNYTTTPVTLKTFTTQDMSFISSSEKGLFMLATWDKTNAKWLLTNVNEANRNFKASQTILNVNITDNTGATEYTLSTFSALPVASEGMTVITSFVHTPSASQPITLNIIIKRNGSAVFTTAIQEPNPGSGFERRVTVMKTFTSFVKGDVITVIATGSAGGASVTTISEGEVTMFCNDGNTN